MESTLNNPKRNSSRIDTAAPQVTAKKQQVSDTSGLGATGGTVSKSLRDVDLMTLLSDNVLYALEKHFRHFDASGLTLDEFVQVVVLVLGRYVVGRRLDFAQQALSLFKQIDVDGSNTVSWAEFTSFIVDQVGNRTKAVTQQGGWEEYVLSGDLTTSALSRGKIHTVSYSPDHSCFAVFDHNSDVGKIYQLCGGDTLSMYQRQTLRHHTSFAPHTCTAVYMVPGTNIVVTSSKQQSRRKRAIYWMSFFQLGKALPYHRLQLANGVSQIFYSEKSKLLYAAGSGTIVGRDLKSFAKVATLKWHTATVTSILQHQEDLISCSRDGTVCIWDTVTYSNRVLVAHSAGVRSIAANENPPCFVSIGFEKGARSDAVNIAVWDLKRGRIIRYLHGHSAPISQIQFRSGRTDSLLEYRALLSADVSGEVRVWNIAGNNSNTCIQVLNLQTPLGSRGARFWGFLEFERVVTAYTSVDDAQENHAHPECKNKDNCDDSESTNTTSAGIQSQDETSNKTQNNADTKILSLPGQKPLIHESIKKKPGEANTQYPTKTKQSVVVAFRDDFAYLQLSLERVYPLPRQVVCVLFNSQLACFVVVTRDAIHKYDSTTGKWIQTFACGAKCLAICRVSQERQHDMEDNCRARRRVDETLSSSGEKLEITSACLGKNMRSLIIGDDHGHIHMHNLSNGSVSKYIGRHTVGTLKSREALASPRNAINPNGLHPLRTAKTAPSSDQAHSHKQLDQKQISRAQSPPMGVSKRVRNAPVVPVSALAYSPSDDCIVSSSWGGQLRVIDNRFGASHATKKTHPSTAPLPNTNAPKGFSPWRLADSEHQTHSSNTTAQEESDVLRQVQLSPEVVDAQDSACSPPDVQAMVFNANLNIVVTLCRGGFLKRDQGLYIWDFEFARLLGQCNLSKLVLYGSCDDDDSSDGEETKSKEDQREKFGGVDFPLLESHSSGELTCMCTCKRLPVLCTASNMDIITLWGLPPMKSNAFEPLAVFKVDLKTSTMIAKHNDDSDDTNLNVTSTAESKQVEEEDEEKEEDIEESITRISARALFHNQPRHSLPSRRRRSSQHQVETPNPTISGGMDIELVLGTDCGKVLMCIVPWELLKSFGVQAVPSQRKPSYRAHRLVHRTVTQGDLWTEAEQAERRKEQSWGGSCTKAVIRDLVPVTSWIIDNINITNAGDDEDGARSPVTFLDFLGDQEEDLSYEQSSSGPGIVLVGLACGIASVFDTTGVSLGLMNPARIDESQEAGAWDFSAILAKRSGADLQQEARGVLGKLMMDPDEVISREQGLQHSADMVQTRSRRSPQSQSPQRITSSGMQQTDMQGVQRPTTSGFTELRGTFTDPPKSNGVLENNTRNSRSGRHLSGKQQSNRHLSVKQRSSKNLSGKQDSSRNLHVKHRSKRNMLGKQQSSSRYLPGKLRSSTRDLCGSLGSGDETDDEANQVPFENVRRALRRLNNAPTPRTDTNSTARPATVHWQSDGRQAAFLTQLEPITRPYTSTGSSTSRCPSEGVSNNNDGQNSPDEVGHVEQSAFGMPKHWHGELGMTDLDTEQARLARRSRQMKRMRQRAAMKREIRPRSRASAIRALARNRSSDANKLPLKSPVQQPGRIAQRFLTPMPVTDPEGHRMQPATIPNHKQNGGSIAENTTVRSAMVNKPKKRDIELPARTYRTYSTIGKYLEDAMPG